MEKNEKIDQERVSLHRSLYLSGLLTAMHEGLEYLESIQETKYRDSYRVFLSKLEDLFALFHNALFFFCLITEDDEFSENLSKESVDTFVSIRNHLVKLLNEEAIRKENEGIYDNSSTTVRFLLTTTSYCSLITNPNPELIAEASRNDHFYPE